MATTLCDSILWIRMSHARPGGNLSFDMATYLDAEHHVCLGAFAWCTAAVGVEKSVQTILSFTLLVHGYV